MSASRLHETVAALMPQARGDLAELVSHRSIAEPRLSLGDECAAAARWIADALTRDGFRDVALLDTPDGTQSVYGFLPGPAGSPTVLLYSHYDVQPPLEESAWVSPPFELTERDGRWYGRGAADCKGGLIMHLTALRALRDCGGVPVNVKIVVEGSEEQGTGGLERYAEAHPELLAADAILVGDAGNFRAGTPTVTSQLRGMTMVEVLVETLKGDLHSGQFGGVAPDALAALIRMLDSLWDGTGATAIEGVGADGTWEGMQYPEELFRDDAGILDGVGLVGTGSVADRLWARPSVGVMGIDCPPVVGGSPTLHATARALLALRIPSGVGVGQATAALTAHLESAAPWGARVTVTPRGNGGAFRADTSSPAYEAMAAAMFSAYGKALQIAGHGGGIPLCNTLARLYPKAEILLIGLNEPEARIHAVNESVSPDELEKLALAEAHFLENYAASASA
ncbi:dipeptidase [Planotetraspora phitsanulokensis]|uniref:Dipeptidase n=1 Tax=Planotetraspora phitsanulokensis TaxID=575192 RepID=A0A8J3U459_9ACTN|nr:dipeptidase [Planotetraspora phitsanulokensis]GII37622.1 dipeptidase [Planotetraspora phitsanulokensis]